MYLYIGNILSEIDNPDVFKPMLWRGKTGEISIPVIGTVVINEKTQIKYITTERRPIIFKSTVRGSVELLTLQEFCNNYTLLNGDVITPMKLKNQCMWLSIADARINYKAQQYKLHQEFADTRNKQISTIVTDDVLSDDITLDRTITMPFGYVYLLESLHCKMKDTPVLVYELPHGTQVGFSATSIFLSANAPMREYNVRSYINDVWYLVCPIVDGTPMVSSLIPVNKQTLLNEFMCY